MQFVDYEDSPYKKEVRKLYYSAFPFNERPPFPLFRYMTKKKTSALYALQEGSLFVGLMAISQVRDVVCVMFLAIDERLRGQGYGSKVLAEVKKKYASDRICLAMEPIEEEAQNYEERVRRKHFYNSNGFYECGFRSNEAGTDFEILSDGEPVTKEEYIEVNGAFFGKALYNILIRI